MLRLPECGVYSGRSEEELGPEKSCQRDRKDGRGRRDRKGGRKGRNERDGPYSPNRRKNHARL